MILLGLKSIFGVMNKRLPNIIIIITAIALSGIIITQYFWVKDALIMKNDQFYQNANLGLKRVVNQLMSLQNDSATAAKFLNLKDGENYHTQFIHSLSPELIEAMINSEFQNLELSDKFYYGIFNKNTKEFVMLSNPDFKNEILNSEHKATISCIFQKEKFVLAAYFPFERAFIYNQMQLYVILSAAFMLITIAGFWQTARSFLRQKKLHEMKTDFVNNMTHELKTPIATISVTSEMLMKENIRVNPEKVKNYADIIFNENQRLKNQVDQVLHVAILDRKNYRLRISRVDIHEQINQVVSRFEIAVTERGGRFMKRLNAANCEVAGDKNHLLNVLTNLVDNANKYSPETPEITISTSNNRKGIFIMIEDRGIGIAENDLKDIFKKFHRISTGDLHDVKGFGIGLFYVKSIVMAHGGSINVKSKPGKGSCFTIWLPFKNHPNV